MFILCSPCAQENHKTKTTLHQSYNLFLDESDLCTSACMNNVGQRCGTQVHNPLAQAQKNKKEEGHDLIWYLAPILTYWCCYQQYARSGNNKHNSAS